MYIISQVIRQAGKQVIMLNRQTNSSWLSNQVDRQLINSYLGKKLVQGNQVGIQVDRFLCNQVDMWVGIQVVGKYRKTSIGLWRLFLQTQQGASAFRD